MLNKIVKILEKSSGRLNIPKDLLDFIGIKINEQIALCKAGDEFIKIKPLHMVQDCKIIGISKMDNKGRFVVPKYLLEDKEETFFEIFILNGDLLIKEVEV